MNRTTFSQKSEFVNAMRIEIEGIPCMVYRPIGEKKGYPTVIYYHGWSSCKDFQVFKGEVLASYGYQVIMPDAIHHGEREPIDHQQEGMLEKYFRKVLLQSVEESEIILRYVRKELAVEKNRIAVMGHSMGGFISSGVFVKDQDLKTVIVLNGSSAWSIVEDEMRETGTEDDLTPKEEERLRQFDPYHHLDALKGRPVCLIHGEKDSAVPIEGQEEFYHKLEEIYRENPEKIRFFKVPRMDHYISTGMFEESISWLKNHL